MNDYGIIHLRWEKRHELMLPANSAKLQTAAAKPDYDALRDRTLNKLKVGRQSAAGKAIDAFIRELKRESEDLRQ